MPDRRIVLGGLVAAGLAFWALTDVPDTPAPTGEFIDVDGTRLHYRILGDGPPVIVVHGAGGNLRDWTMGPAAELAVRNRVLVFDRPGHGFSDRPTTDGDRLSVQAALMRKAAAELGFADAILVGHSFGGSISLAWALDDPDSLSGLVLLAAPSQVWEGGVDATYHLNGTPVLGDIASRVLPRIVPQSYVAGVIETVFQPESPPANYAEQFGVGLSLQPAALRHNARDVLALKAQIAQMVPRYSEITLPVRLIHGRADKSVFYDVHNEQTLAALPNAESTPIDGAGHMLHHTQTDALVAAVESLKAAR